VLHAGALSWCRLIDRGLRYSAAAGPGDDRLGPHYVIGQQLAEVDGLPEAVLYGSWAARFQGEPGELPNDIDVLIAGTADRDDSMTDIAKRRDSCTSEINPTFPPMFGASRVWASSNRARSAPAVDEVDP
jgi:hypothetical protein